MGGVAVERSSSSVVARRRSRVRVRRRLLHVTQRNRCVERRGDEAVPQRVGTDPLVDPRSLRQPSPDPSRRVPIESTRAIVVHEDRARLALTDVEIERPRRPMRQRDRGGLVARAMNEQGAVTSVEVDVDDVRAESFRDAQPIEREQTRECVIAPASEPGLDEERAEISRVDLRG